MAKMIVLTCSPVTAGRHYRAFLEEHVTPDDLVRDLVGKGYDLAGAHGTVTRVLRLIEVSE